MPKGIEQYVAEAAANFKRGTAEMVVLALLSAREQYAYELTKSLKKISRSLFDLQGPALYTVLYRLQEKGFVSTRDEKIGRRTRVYYHLLPAGKDYLERITNEYKSVTEGIAEVLDATVKKEGDTE